MTPKSQALWRATMLKVRTAISDCRRSQSEAKAAQLQAILAHSRAERSWKRAEYLILQTTKQGITHLSI